MSSKILTVFTFILIPFEIVYGEKVKDNVMDWELYKKVLDPELCQQQLETTLRHPRLLSRFLDAGAKIPRGITHGNLIDLGNYYECLAINKNFDNSTIEGKYCVINISLEQDKVLKEINEVLDLNNTSIRANDISETRMANGIVQMFTKVKNLTRSVVKYYRILGPEEGNLKLAICIPKPCTSRQAFDFIFNFTAVGVAYEERYCRLPDDKPWVLVDYLTIGIFFTIGVLTLLSTIYEARHSGTDRNQCTAFYKAFSFSKNLQKITRHNKGSTSGFLECLDGIRALSMVWIVVGHAFVLPLLGKFLPANIIESAQFLFSLKALWITNSQYAVDSFLVLSGLLTVYIIRGRITSMALLKNIHIFYLNRVLRMLPILATGVLLQASLLHHAIDGPFWEYWAHQTDSCRRRWWYTLLFIQNFLRPNQICLGHTWYLGVDVQLHILSPLVLFWVLSKRRYAWTALVISLVISILGPALYNFIMEFPAVPIQPTRMHDLLYYFQNHYFMPFTRSSPFVIGMLCGYVLSLYKNRTVIIPKMLVCSMWLISVLIMSGIIYSTYPVLQENWNNQLVDSVINSFSRPLWAICLSWLIFACTHGYGGPINSILSHSLWKLPARLSYGVYIIHYPITEVFISSSTAPLYFTATAVYFRFWSILGISLFLSFIVTVLIDGPFAEIVRLILNKYAKNMQRDKMEEEVKVNGKDVEVVNIKL